MGRRQRATRGRQPSGRRCLSARVLRGPAAESMQPRSERPAGRTQSPEHGSPGPAPEAPPPPPPPPPAPEAERARPRQPRPAAPMEGHSVAHNSKRHYHDAFVAMSRMRQRGLLCDVVLRVAATEIRAHKVVLASCSPYFHAMFTSKRDEREPPDARDAARH